MWKPFIAQRAHVRTHTWNPPYWNSIGLPHLGCLCRPRRRPPPPTQFPFRRREFECRVSRSFPRSNATQPPHHSWRTRKSPDQLSSCRGIAIDLPSSRSTVKNRFFFRKIDLLNIEMRALVLWNESFFFNYHARDLVKKRIQHLRKFESNYIFFYKINKKSLITNNEEND